MPLLLSQLPFVPNLVEKNKNKEKIKWKKTDNKNQDENNEQNTNDPLFNIPKLTITRSTILYFNGTLSPHVSSAIFCYKPDILGDLINSLKKIGIAKNKRKKLYNIVMQEN